MFNLVSVDIGLKGCLVFWGDPLLVLPMPLMPILVNKKKKFVIDIENIIKILKRQYTKSSIIVMEDVNSFGMGRTGAFNFGLQKGLLIGAAKSIGYKVELVQPASWKKCFPVLFQSPEVRILRQRAKLESGKEKEKTNRMIKKWAKMMAVDYVENKYSMIGIGDGIADAVMIGEYYLNNSWKGE